METKWKLQDVDQLKFDVGELKDLLTNSKGGQFLTKASSQNHKPLLIYLPSFNLNFPKLSQNSPTSRNFQVK